ncbi:MAG: 50S ribosomal protein L9 [Halanaerobiaceae bacterium]
MEIILKEDVENLGSAGEIVEVADGYARNYLLPRKMAVTATKQKKKEIEKIKEKQRKKEQEKRGEAEQTADELSDKKYVFSVKAGEQGRLFGSVTSNDIAGKLEKDGYDIDKREIELDGNIKSLGVHKVPVKIYDDIYAEIKVEVVEAEE